MKNNKEQKFSKNIFYAFTAQSISLLVSVLTTLFVPRLLGVESFGFWQLFVFYSSYVGFFHLGVNDGLYLRLGGEKYSELDHSLIGVQFKLLLLLQLIISAIIIIGSVFFVDDSNRLFVIVGTAIFLIITNLWGYLSLLLKAVNEIKSFSVSAIIDRMFFAIGVIGLIIAQIDNLHYLVIFSILGRIFALIYCVSRCRQVIFCKKTSLKIIINEFIINLKTGVILMLANIANMVILGVGKLVIDNTWGIVIFGIVSFAITLTNFFFMFVGQIGMVLFPTLRKMDESKLKSTFANIRNLLGIFLPIIFLLYIPMSELLVLWLPSYAQSFRYLILFLPLCIFDGKMKLLYTTYFKVMREEKKLLIINCIGTIISLVVSLIGAYVFRNLYVIIFGLLISIAIKSVIAELYLSRKMQNNTIRLLIQEFALVVIFVSATWFLSSIYSLIIVAISYLIHLFINRSLVNKYIVLESTL